MKYPKYSKYKDSGVEWIGEIPKEWNAVKLGNFAKAKSGKRPPLIEIDGKIPIYGANGVIGHTNISMNNELKLLVGRVGSSGAVNIAYPPCWISDNVLIISYDSNVLSFNFLYHLLGLSDYSIEKFNTAQPLITSSALMAKKIPIPPIEEQAKIENFLDEVSNKIGKLIKYIMETVELLKEKRQAIITNAVTKGLEPNVPMKDSGIEWVGQIPEHWKLSRIKFVSEVTMGQSPPSYSYLDHGELPFLQGCAEFGEISPNPKHYCEIATKISYPGDILLSVRAPVGELNLSDRFYGIGRGLCSIRSLRTGVDYLKWYLHVAKNNLISLSNGSTYDAVTISDVKNLKIPISKDKLEQDTISEYINTETSKIDILISKQHNMIELLNEYKTSLITQAVTGKIDVRGFTPPTASSDSLH